MHGDTITADFEEGKEELSFQVSKSGEVSKLASDERPAEKPDADEADAKQLDISTKGPVAGKRPAGSFCGFAHCHIALAAREVIVTAVATYLARRFTAVYGGAAFI